MGEMEFERKALVKAVDGAFIINRLQRLSRSLPGSCATRFSCIMIAPVAGRAFCQRLEARREPSRTTRYAGD